MAHYKIHYKDNGSQFWYQNNILHRVDGPAVIYSNGSHSLGCEGTQSLRTQIWYQDDKKHRVGGPAVIYSDGTKRWYQNGKLHRENGPAIMYPEGTKRWYWNDVKFALV
jgi:hypothetical protein